MANFISTFEKDGAIHATENKKVLIGKGDILYRTGVVIRTFSHFEKDGKKFFTKNRTSSIGDVEFMGNVAYIKNVDSIYDAENEKVNLSKATFTSKYNKEEEKISFIE